MEAAITNDTLTSGFFCNKEIERFFESNSTDSVKDMLLRIFQCWVTKDCNIKADISDEEVALFFDQLMDLVAAAYILHQANRVSPNQREGNGHE
jgi:hypothetical protein